MKRAYTLLLGRSRLQVPVLSTAAVPCRRASSLHAVSPTKALSRSQGDVEQGQGGQGSCAVHQGYSTLLACTDIWTPGWCLHAPLNKSTIAGNLGSPLPAAAPRSHACSLLAPAMHHSLLLDGTSLKAEGAVLQGSVWEWLRPRQARTQAKP